MQTLEVHDKKSIGINRGGIKGKFENDQRLQRCLKGEARETVLSVLIHPDNVPVVITAISIPPSKIAH